MHVRLTCLPIFNAERESEDLLGVNPVEVRVLSAASEKPRDSRFFFVRGWYLGSRPDAPKLARFDGNAPVWPTKANIRCIRFRTLIIERVDGRSRQLRPNDAPPRATRR